MEVWLFLVSSSVWWARRFDDLYVRGTLAARCPALSDALVQLGRSKPNPRHGRCFQDHSSTLRRSPPVVHLEDHQRILEGITSHQAAKGAWLPLN
jgi:hypothetical protein